MLKTWALFLKTPRKYTFYSRGILNFLVRKRKVEVNRNRYKRASLFIDIMTNVITVCFTKVKLLKPVAGVS